MVTSTSASLQWSVTFDGNSPIQYFTLSYNSSEDSLSINTTADKREHTFTGLLAATRYMFKAVATNKIGTSSAAMAMDDTVGAGNVVIVYEFVIKKEKKTEKKMQNVFIFNKFLSYF